MNAKRKGFGMPNSVAQGTRVLGRSSGNSAILFGTSKSNAASIVIPESPLEKTVAQLAELDPRVVRFQCQPFTIDIVSGKIYENRADLLAARNLRKKNEVKIREYTPDIFFHLVTNQKIAAEIKDERYLGDAAYMNKVNMAAEILKAMGLSFVFMTMLYEESHPLVQNAKLLTQFKKIYDGEISEAQIKILKNFLDAGPRTLGEVCQQLKLSLRESPVLILQGHVSIDLRSQRICAASLVRQGHGDFTNLKLLRFDGDVA